MGRLRPTEHNHDVRPLRANAKSSNRRNIRDAPCLIENRSLCVELKIIAATPFVGVIHRVAL